MNLQKYVERNYSEMISNAVRGIEVGRITKERFLNMVTEQISKAWQKEWIEENPMYFKDYRGRARELLSLIRNKEQEIKLQLEIDLEKCKQEIE